MNYNEELNIVVASDQNYVSHLMTLIGSIGSNNKQVGSILIHVLDGGIEEKAKRKIEKLKDKFCNISFAFYKMTEDILREKLGGGTGRQKSFSIRSHFYTRIN